MQLTEPQLTVVVITANVAPADVPKRSSLPSRLPKSDRPAARPGRGFRLQRVPVDGPDRSGTSEHSEHDAVNHAPRAAFAFEHPAEHRRPARTGRSG